MKYYSLLLLLVFLSTFWTACKDETIRNTADFEFVTLDKGENRIDLYVTVRYKLKSRLEKKLSRQYGRHYQDSLILPIVSSVSDKILKNYSAGEIYSFRRDEVEQKLSEQTKSAFSESALELTAFFIRSVGLDDSLMRRLEAEYAERFEHSINKCSKETTGVVTEIDEHGDGHRVVFFEFTVANKNYKSILGPEGEKSKVKTGDTLVIEYACEDAIYHRVKR